MQKCVAQRSKWEVQVSSQSLRCIKTLSARKELKWFVKIASSKTARQPSSRAEEVSYLACLLLALSTILEHSSLLIGRTSKITPVDLRFCTMSQHELIPSLRVQQPVLELHIQLSLLLRSSVFFTQVHNTIIVRVRAHSQHVLSTKLLLVTLQNEQATSEKDEIMQIWGDGK